jgi:hypothetical protein
VLARDARSLPHARLVFAICLASVVNPKFNLKLARLHRCATHGAFVMCIYTEEAIWHVCRMYTHGKVPRFFIIFIFVYLPALLNQFAYICF